MKNNKKSQSEVITIVLLISLVLASIVIVMIIVVPFVKNSICPSCNKPLVKNITVEKCENKTTTIETWSDSKEKDSYFALPLDLKPNEIYSVYDLEKKLASITRYNSSSERLGVKYTSFVNLTAEYFDKNDGKIKPYHALEDENGIPIEVNQNFPADSSGKIINPSNNFVRSKVTFYVAYTSWNVSERNKTYEVCTTEEVNSINQEILSEVGNKFIDGYLDGKVYDSLGNEELHCRIIVNRTYYVLEVVKNKSDITKEWLDNKCECIERQNERCNLVKGSYQIGGLNKDECDMNRGTWIYDCSKYKCTFDEKYIIEVNN